MNLQNFEKSWGTFHIPIRLYLLFFWLRTVDLPLLLRNLSWNKHLRFLLAIFVARSLILPGTRRSDSVIQLKLINLQIFSCFFVMRDTEEHFARLW